MPCRCRIPLKGFRIILRDSSTLFVQSILYSAPFLPCCAACRNHLPAVISSFATPRPYYRNQRLGFRELKAAIALGDARGAAPSPAPPSPILRRSLPPASSHPWRKGFSAKARPLFRGRMKPNQGDSSIVDKTGTFLLWYDKSICSN